MFFQKRSGAVAEETTTPFNPALPAEQATSPVALPAGAPAVPAIGHNVGDINIDRVDFAGLPPNPWQRNTVAHAKKIEPYLRTHMPAHEEVKIVIVVPTKAKLADCVETQMDNGFSVQEWFRHARRQKWPIYKLDGHTTSYIHDGGDPDPAYAKIYKPAKYRAKVYACLPEELEALYNAENSRASVKTTGNDLESVAGHAGFVPKSHYFKKSTYLKAVELAERVALGLSYIQDAKLDPNPIPRWVKVLRVADEIVFEHTAPFGGLTAGILLTLRRWPLEAPVFWKAYFERTGTSILSPTIVLRKRIEALTNSKSRETRAAAAEAAVSAFETWRLNRNAEIKALHRMKLDGYLG